MNTKKTLFTTAALGVAYLLKNKGTRDKIMNSVQSFTSQSKAKKIQWHSLIFISLTKAKKPLL
ncbi:hypothetical protein [Paenibacillus sp. FSL R10-2734]|uniref:hypothetical protein n=1 Tax=Paenibacillus sp. FSL R10-2734 TaxID=2954691 RepID=UPI0030DC6818